MPAPAITDELDDLADGETLDLMGDTGFPGTVEAIFEAGGQFALLTPHDFNVSVASDLDGEYDEIVTVPVIAREQAALNLYVLLTSGFYHRIRVDATHRPQYFHLKLIEATMYYQGQLA